MKGETIGTLIVFTVLAIALWRVRSDFTEPEQRTQRPAPVEPCDFSEALKPLGGLPSWEDTRKQR